MLKRKNKKHGPSQATIQTRALKIGECLRLYPDQIALSLARHPEASWVFGRLYLIGVLSRHQYEVAVKLDRVVRRYRRLLAPHGKIKGFNPDALAAIARSAEDLSPEAQRRMLQAKQDYEGLYHALSQQGKDVVDAVITALDKDKPTDLHCIRKGLNALLALT